MAGVTAAGYTEPTPIQAQSIPVTLQGRDVLGLAQTGTGKTAAFLLPILNRLLTNNSRKVRALIVAPTRELAEQIREESEKLGRGTNIRSIAIYGGVGKQPQINKLRKGAEIVVACPGRLLDLVNSKLIDLSHVEVLVLDEADSMFDMGFLPDIRRIFKHVPNNRQILLFSATMPKDIRKLADEYLENPATVQIGMIAPAKTVSHALYPVTKELKKPLLLQMLENLEDANQLLIFTRTKYRARNLARDLERKGYNATALQGNMSQNQRQRAITGFRDGKFDILVATDIAARGIDVTNVTHVINFDIPDTVDAYTHRIGRTGRAHATGEAYTFVMDDEYVMVRDIERLLGNPIERRRLAGFDYGSFDPDNAIPVKPARRSGGGQSQSHRHGSSRQGNRPSQSKNGSGGNKNNRRRRSRNRKPAATK